MNATAAGSLSECFSEIRDPRLKRKQRHSLHDILMVSACAMICRVETFVEIEKFGESERGVVQYLSKAAKGHSQPRHLQPGLRASVAEDLSECFTRWTAGLRQAICEEVVAIDVKSLRGSHSEDHGPIHMVSAWASENRLVLGQMKVEEKTNEITAIPELLRALQPGYCSEYRRAETVCCRFRDACTSNRSEYRNSGPFSTTGKGKE